MFRQLLSKILMPNLDKDLARTVSREVAKMDATLHFAPSVYCYRPKGMGGAFGISPASHMRQQVELIRVDIPFKANRGLFH